VDGLYTIYLVNKKKFWGKVKKMTKTKKIIVYDDGWKSKIMYYTKRTSKDAISLIVAGVVSFMLQDPRFIVLIPILSIIQKVAKEQGYWY